MAIYIVDSNFFIQAHRTTYPLDVAIGFWNKIRKLADSRLIVSIDKVKKEIYNKNDALKSWCKLHLPPDFFRSTDDLLDEYGKVTSWALSRRNHYLPNALNEFLDADEADAFIIAYCLSEPAYKILVTYETSEPGRKNKIKIPDCCIALGVSYTNPIQMFRQLGETF
jgi:hypothetical protein